MKPCEKWVKSREIIPPVKVKKPSIVKICEAPIADTAATPYVEFAKLAKEIGTEESNQNLGLHEGSNRAVPGSSSAAEYFQNFTGEDAP
ncbi:hypothetical protein RR46_09753 [Papilio xuthus]|uniref:Uncharacterized protein n=1 Tax=Papilio xuthus TaxID=66420 RepID=A0A194QC34_PAPXU|nr:hypothetical protein RR46_09753 [Papilio xuthus]